MTVHFVGHTAAVTAVAAVAAVAAAAAAAHYVSIDHCTAHPDVLLYLDDSSPPVRS